MKIKKLNFLKRGFCFAMSFLFIVGLASTPLQNAKADVSAPQQSQAVSGTVKDATGESLVGVNVVEIGTTNGTITDIDGNYSLNVRANATLQFTYIGYTPQTLSVSGARLDVILREDVQSLSEVVVVGYGTQQKKDITGSVAVIKTEELKKSTGVSAMTMLQGKAAGVYIATSGAPGSQTMVRIRGLNTVNDNGPLYVIDGVSSRNQDLASINPNDIESMQILKDASSSAIYGAQAANGVILITTKKGSKTGQPTVSYDGYYGIANTTKKYDVLNSMDRLQLEWDAKASNYKILGADNLPSHVQFGTGASPKIPNYLTVAGAGGRTDINPNDYSYPNGSIVPFSDTDWWDELDRTGTRQSHQITLSGGTEKGQYLFSANLYDEKGTQIVSYYKKYTVRSNASFNIRPWLRFGENLQFAYTKDLSRSPNTAESSGYSWTYRSSPWVPVRDIQGNYAGSKIAGTGNWQNVVAIREREKDNYWQNSRVFGNMYAEADLIPGLTFRTSFGLDYGTNYSYRMDKKNLEFSESPGQNNFEEAAGHRLRWIFSNTLTYSKVFNDIHRLTVLVGSEAIKDNLGHGMNARRYNYLYEDNTDTWTLAMGENNSQRTNNSWYHGEMALFGLFGRLDYAFKDKYLLTVNMRRDGVSRFAESERYGIFPAASVGWRLSEESFMESTKSWLDDLKIRVGYGQTGNSDVPRTFNFANEFTTDPARTNYDVGGSDAMQTGYRLQRYGNTETKWEATETYNAGLDATFLQGKFNINFELYSKKTTNMLLRAAYSNLAGEGEAPYINYGDMSNKGWELQLNYNDSKGDWSWGATLNLDHYKNEIGRLSESDEFALWGGGARLDGNITRTRKGEPMSMFYGYKVIGFYENAQEVLALPPLGRNYTTVQEAEAFVGKFKFEDFDGDGRITSADRQTIGNPHPDLSASLNLNVAYKNFDVTAFFYSMIGNEIFNNTKYFTDFWLFEGNRSSRVRDLSWKQGADNSKAVLPILDYGDGYSGTNPNSYYVENGSFLKLKNFVVGYTFPKQLLQKSSISNLRIYIQGENIFTLTKYEGLDPETSNAEVGAGSGSDLRKGIDMGGWPTSRNFIFGVNFRF